MADIESISHCGVLAADTRELAETMELVLGSQRLVTGERAYANRRGGAPHPHEMIGDFMMVTFPYPPGWTVDIDPTEIALVNGDAWIAVRRQQVSVTLS